MRKRFFVAALLLIVMLIASSAVALADADVPPTNLISENPNFSMYEWRRTVMPYAADALAITRVVASISKYSSSSVYIRGVTETNKEACIIGVIMYVEQWKNNQWNSYSMSSVTDYDTFMMSGTKVVNVDPGYYYRLVVKHRAIGISESAYDVSYTNSIYVN